MIKSIFKKIKSLRSKLATDNKGMTLVEIMVSLVIASFIMLAIGGIFMTVSNIVRNYSNQSTNKNLTEDVESFMLTVLPYATTFEVSDIDNPSISSNHVIKFGKNGKVYYDGEDITLSDDYNGKKVRICILAKNPADESSQTTDALFDAQISVTKTDKEDSTQEDMLYQMAVPIKLINIASKSNKSIVYADSLETELIDYDKDTSTEDTLCYLSKEQDIYLYFKTLD